MAVLPSRPAFTLDTLVARARATQSAPARRASKPQAPRPAPRPLADLERASSLAPRPDAPPPTRPVALALWITVATCACGRTHRLPPMYALAKYAENAHSVHYSRADADALGDLPREIREKPVAIPFCEACFTSRIDTETSELRSNLPPTETTLPEHSVAPLSITQEDTRGGTARAVEVSSCSSSTPAVDGSSHSSSAPPHSHSSC